MYKIFNDILSHTYGYVREGGEGCGLGEDKHYFLLTKFFKKLYVQNILYGGTIDFFYKQLRILLGLRVT